MSTALMTIHTVKILQYRSVAFVTYVSELHAQFAKEAMACQSLDNDEILNVRWATEDPNPVQKVAEKRRLEEMGQEAIRARMDPKIVDAMRSVRALEEGDSATSDGQLLLEESERDADEEGSDGERQGKRRRVDYEQEAEEMLKEMEADSPPPEAPPGPKGLLSSDTLEGLRYLAQIRQKSKPAATSKPKAPTKPPLLDLGGYGSEDDE